MVRNSLPTTVKPLPEISDAAEAAAAAKKLLSEGADGIKVFAPFAEGAVEAVVNEAILANGGKLALAPDVIVYQRRQNLRVSTILRERRIWGRSFGAWRCQSASTLQRLVWIVFSPVLPLLLPLLRSTRPSHFG